MSALITVSCGGDDKALPEGCQPLIAGADCLLPYPSDFFTVADPSMPSGRRIEITGAAKLTSQENANGDVNDWRETDGFSTIPTIVAMFPEQVLVDGLIGLFDDPAMSATSQSPVVIINAATGELVPSYADLDPDPDPPDQAAIVVHPYEPLAPNTRYVVAIHDVVGPSGLITAPDGFRHLRDGDRSFEPIRDLADRYDSSIFPVIEAAGIARGDLQLAWDFTTASEQNQRSDMLAIRDQTQAWLAVQRPVITVDDVETDPLDDVALIIRGRFTVPSFVGDELNRDEVGAVTQSGETEAVFTIVVPTSVAEGEGPGRVLAYGHGFFGSMDEIEGVPARKIANHLGAVLFSTNWVGMSVDDTAAVLLGLSGEPWRALRFTDHVHQAMANWLVFTDAIKNELAAIPELQKGEGAIYDPATVDYMGVSQGHILGGVMISLNDDIRRAILHVGGAGFTHMMFRSANFSPFLAVLEGSLRSRLDQLKYIATTQNHMDRIDPAVFASMVTQPVLMQAALGDSSVPNIGTFLHARALGVALVDPSPASVFGLEPASAPIEGSALALYDYGLDTKSLYEEMRPPGRNEAHDSLRTADPVLAQMKTFLEEGVVAHACEGPCVLPPLD